MKALLDEMLAQAIAEQLRARGHDVISVAERADHRSLPDRDVFAFAQSEGRVIVTRDLADFLQIEREQRAIGQSHAGLVLISPHIAPVTVGPVVTALDELLSGDEPYPGFVHWL